MAASPDAGPEATPQPAPLLVRLAEGAGAVRGWKRRGLALLAGALAAGALPPVHAIPLLLPAFCLLVWMLRGEAGSGRGWGSALTVGFWFGVGHHVAGLYWLAWPMTLDLARFGWMIPFAVFGLSAVLAVFTAGATLLTHLSRLRGVGEILALAAAWTAMEWLRGNILTGFPWNLTATVWTIAPVMLQTASIWGAYGLSLLTLLAFALPAVAGNRDAGRRSRVWSVAAGLGLLGGLCAYGLVRLPGPTAYVEGVHLRLVQAHVPQTLKWAPGSAARIFDLYLSLSGGPGADRITHVIWPETAVAYRFQTRSPSLRISGVRAARLQRVIPAKGALIAGTVRDDGAIGWNSVEVVTRTRVVASYDKHHLVPFGEYVPLRGVLKSLGVERLAQGRLDFAFGTGPATLRAPGLPGFSPLICYEAIFPDEAVGPDRPGFLLNVTNDAWFGVTSGPYQHLAAARLRSVEQGLPLVRAANTGISVVTDAWGRTVARLGLGNRGVLDSKLPRAGAPTPYARIGDWVLIPILLVVLILACFLTLRSKSRHRGWPKRPENGQN